MSPTLSSICSQRLMNEALGVADGATITVIKYANDQEVIASSEEAISNKNDKCNSY